MKNQFFGLFFYVLYLLAMFRPLAPIIEYYANYDYIANVLCENRDKPYLECNGKCYLKKQLDKSNHNNHDHKSTIPQIDLEKYPVSPVDPFFFTLKNFDEKNYKHSYFVNKYTSQDFYQSLLRPPQFVS